jgi:hypothetical protein
MTYIVDRADIVVAAEIADGTFTYNNRTYSVVHKFGRSVTIGTSFAPLSIGNVYQTPQVAGATTLRVKAGNTNDTAAGSGAQAVKLYGIDETGALVEETLATAGTSASSTTSATFIRLFRAYVSAAGAYATPTAGGMAADIVIENGAGGTDWATISSADFDRGQSQIGCYTVPLGKTAYVQQIDVSVDIKAAKPVSLLLMQRRNILQTAAPYSTWRLVEEFDGIETEMHMTENVPLGPFPALTDLVWFAKASATSGCEVNTAIMLVDEL